MRGGAGDQLRRPHPAPGRLPPLPRRAAPPTGGGPPHRRDPRAHALAVGLAPSLEERLAAIEGARPRSLPLGGPAAAYGERCGTDAGCLDLLGGEAAAEDAWYAVATRGELVRMSWDE